MVNQSHECICGSVMHIKTKKQRNTHKNMIKRKQETTKKLGGYSKFWLGQKFGAVVFLKLLRCCLVVFPQFWRVLGVVPSSDPKP